ncbi:hypothetical protein HAX54_024880 [Datura stramonium]|uniref:Uncharacterized protein n=1 Tax=Datura stramonium TaxID=4076 RepID=A0ABS8S5P2_DATST|nr:hypothetical protein [Datura stramonium]
MVTIFNSTLSLESTHQIGFRDCDKDGKPPLCIVSDTFMGFASEVAKTCGTFNVSFTTAGAWHCSYVSVWLNLPHLLASDGVFKMPGFDDSCCFFSVNQLHPFMKSADGNDPWSKVLKSLLSPSLDSLGFLCNSAEKLNLGNTISTSQMMALALGLEEIVKGHSFWVIRPPIGFDIKSIGEFEPRVPIISWPLAAEPSI